VHSNDSITEHCLGSYCCNLDILVASVIDGVQRVDEDATPDLAVVAWDGEQGVTY
jgi:hypothetical protein